MQLSANCDHRARCSIIHHANAKPFVSVISLPSP
jgi:hypothetical protein